MLFRVNPESAVGLADQVAAQVRGALVDGALTPGDRLPPARQVAAGLDINMHTVLRAYQTLRDEGIIDLRRGRGAIVRSDVDASDIALIDAVETLARHAVRGGWSADRVVESLRAAMTRLAGEAPPERRGESPQST